MKVDWSLQSLERIESIQNYIALDSEFYALEFTNKIFETAKLIEDNPKIGRVVPEFSKDSLREIILGNYRIVYLLEETKIEILTVFNSKQILSWEIKLT